ncbi:hypothetical protein, partial [Staphylococcus aureus]|uniref:hypothetical protein n=1 Tax=Staphylococcus aureus TaxID=1280 RepID=UPI00203AC82E
SFAGCELPEQYVQKHMLVVWINQTVDYNKLAKDSENSQLFYKLLYHPCDQAKYNFDNTQSFLK